MTTHESGEVDVRPALPPILWQAEAGWDSAEEQVEHELDQDVFIDDRMQRAIIDTLLRLPMCIAKHAIEQCMFVSFGGTTSGMAFKTHWLNKPDGYIVLLDERTADADLHSLIAHEIAHVWLRHDLHGDGDSERERWEGEVHALVRTWGFSGYGAGSPA